MVELGTRQALAVAARVRILERCAQGAQSGRRSARRRCGAGGDHAPRPRAAQSSEQGESARGHRGGEQSGGRRDRVQEAAQEREVQAAQLGAGTALVALRSIDLIAAQVQHVLALDTALPARELVAGEPGATRALVAQLIQRYSIRDSTRLRDTLRDTLTAQRALDATINSAADALAQDWHLAYVPRFDTCHRATHRPSPAPLQTRSCGSSCCATARVISSLTWHHSSR